MKRRESAHIRRGRGESGEQEIKLFLSEGVKLEILKLTFDAMNCLMKHNNLSC